MTTTTPEAQTPETREGLDPLDRDLAAAAQLRSLGHLRDGLEHELRSPLHSIVLNLELLKELARSGALSPEAVETRLESIGAGLHRLQTGISDLLRLTQEPGGEPERFELSDLLEDVRAAVAGQAKQVGLALEVDPGESPQWIEGRRGALTQAVLHVAVNALLSSSQGDRIRLEATRSERGPAVVVRDSGRGVAREDRERIFERHFTTRSGRSGPGLYVARTLVEADGGSLDLESTGSEGSVFIAIFPEATP